jgi:hypothetical protein
MQRVETLVEKLQQQLKEHASVDQLLLTAHMLQHELIHSQSAAIENESAAVKVSMPFSLSVPTNLYATTDTEPEPVKVEVKKIVQEKIVEVLQIDEAEVEAELEEIKRNADIRQKLTAHNKQPMMFDMDHHDDEIPTLVLHNVTTKTVVREINETVVVEKTSLNDKLKESKTEVAQMLVDTPVKDIKKAIGVNDRFVFINELFRGDEVMYERSIKTINSFDIWPEAEYWIRRELKLKLSWQDKNEIVQQFDQVVKRRFS